MLDQTLIVEQRWQSHPVNVQHARETARAVIARYDTQEAELLELAIGEACANAVEHGSPQGEANSFCLRCYLDTTRPALVFEVEDEGCDFNLTGLSLAAVPNLDSENGRGLFLMNAIMDEVALHSTPRGLNVRMSKTLRYAAAS